MTMATAATRMFALPMPITCQTEPGASSRSPDRRGRRTLRASPAPDPWVKSPGRTWRARSAEPVRSLVYSLPRSVCMTQPCSRPPRPTVIRRAATGSSARWWSAIAQPTTSRVARSIQIARYNFPSSVLSSVMSPTNRIPGWGAVKSRPIRSSANTARFACQVRPRRRRRVIPTIRCLRIRRSIFLEFTTRPATPQGGVDPRSPRRHREIRREAPGSRPPAPPRLAPASSGPAVVPCARSRWNGALPAHDTKTQRCDLQDYPPMPSRHR